MATFVEVAAWFLDNLGEHVSSACAELREKYPEHPDLVADCVVVCALSNGVEGLPLRLYHVENVNPEHPDVDALKRERADALIQFFADKRSKAK